jgi:hypothetical protein
VNTTVHIPWREACLITALVIWPCVYFFARSRRNRGCAERSGGFELFVAFGIIGSLLLNVALAWPSLVSVALAAFHLCVATPAAIWCLIRLGINRNKFPLRTVTVVLLGVGAIGPLAIFALGYLVL